MDFFCDLFTTTPTEARTELDSEVAQVPVDFESGWKYDGGCIVA